MPNERQRAVAAVLELPQRIADERLTLSPRGWVTTTTRAGVPVPTPVWFTFDGLELTVYQRPDSALVAGVRRNPQVSVHLDSDHRGGGIVIVGGRAAVGARRADPRRDGAYWAKYRHQAATAGLTDAIADCSTRITITPSLVWAGA